MLKILFYMVLSASLAGSTAAVGILLLKRILLGRLSPRIERGLWLAAIVLYLIPVRQLLPPDIITPAEYMGTPYVLTVTQDDQSLPKPANR